MWQASSGGVGVGIHSLSRNKLHVKPLNSELMRPICYNIVAVQLPILLTTVRVRFLENTNAIISVSCFRHSNDTLCPQDEIPNLFSGHEAPIGCPLLLPQPPEASCSSCYLQCCPAATLASFQLPEGINPSQICSLSRNLSPLFLENLSKYFVLHISI